MTDATGSADDVLLDLAQGYWNLVDMLATKAIEAGLPPDEVAHAVKKLAQKNQQTMTRETGPIVNDPIWKIYDALRDPG